MPLKLTERPNVCLVTEREGRRDIIRVENHKRKQPVVSRVVMFGTAIRHAERECERNGESVFLSLAGPSFEGHIFSKTGGDFWSQVSLPIDDARDLYEKRRGFMEELAAL